MHHKCISSAASVWDYNFLLKLPVGISGLLDNRSRDLLCPCCLTYAMQLLVTVHCMQVVNITMQRNIQKCILPMLARLDTNWDKCVLDSTTRKWGNVPPTTPAVTLINRVNARIKDITAPCHWGRASTMLVQDARIEGIGFEQTQIQA